MLKKMVEGTPGILSIYRLFLFMILPMTAVTFMYRDLIIRFLFVVMTAQWSSITLELGIQYSEQFAKGA